MNYSHSQDDKIIGTQVKALAFVFIAGFIALSANRVIVAPPESSTPGSTLRAASEMAVATTSPAATFYPVLAPDAVQDEDGHPASF